MECLSSQIRKEKGITQQELADGIGISRRALSSVENSSAIPSVQVAMKMATILGVTVEEVFCDEDDTKKRLQAYAEKLSKLKQKD